MIAAAAIVRGTGLRLACPAAQRSEAGAAGQVEAITAETLAELVNKLNSGDANETLETGNEPGTRAALPSIDDLHAAPTVKEAAAIAAAGRHHILLTGDNQAGQTALARCIAAMMPDPAEHEQGAVWTIHSAAGLLDPAGNDWPRRPVQFPHPSTNRTAIAGKTNPWGDPSDPDGMSRCGTLTLAHQGVLIINELERWDEDVLEAIGEAAERGCTPAENGNLPARVLMRRSRREATKALWRRAASCAQSREPSAASSRSAHGWDAGATSADEPGTISGTCAESTLRKQIATAERAQEEHYEQGGRNGTERADLVYGRARLTNPATQRLNEHGGPEGGESAIRVLRVARTLADMRGEETVTSALIDEAAGRETGTAEPIE